MSSGMRVMRVPSALVAPVSEEPLSAAAVTAVWEIADAVAALKLREVPPAGVVLPVPSKRLRGECGRSDNHWLVECLRRLTRVEIGGERDGQPWGGVLVAEWRLTDGGATVWLVLPPAALAVLVAPATFAQLEADAVYRLPPNAMRLYGLLADRRRQRVPAWSSAVDELRTLLGLQGRRAYRDFSTFRKDVLEPSLAAINDLCPVEVRMTPERRGRWVASVRFDWKWREPGEAAGTVAENERHSKARRRRQSAADAPPLVPMGPAIGGDTGVGSLRAAPAVLVAELSPLQRARVRADQTVMVGDAVIVPGSPAMIALREAVVADDAERRAGDGQ